MVTEETKENLKRGAKSGLTVIFDGVVVLFKLIMIIITGFAKAITIDFFRNIRENWKSAFKKGEKKEEKPKEEKKEEPKGK